MGYIAKKMAHASAWTLETVMSELALPAAVLSTTSNGSYLDRAFAGLTTTCHMIKGGLGAYIYNTGVKDVVNGLGLEVIKSAGQVAQNIQEDPYKALYAAIATYAACKLVPIASKKVRKLLTQPKTKK